MSTENRTQAPFPLPRVAILATGGTIAGRAASASKTTDYVSGVLDVCTLLEAIPEIADHARVECEQIASIGSEDMTEDVWLRLARRLNELLADSGIAGAVVLHGTDTMEETAYFLHLTLKSGKPVILTGAMRPANAVSADGPINILNAVRLAACPEAAGKGVFIALNETINAAREAVKVNTLNPAAFDSPGVGPIGVLVDGAPKFYRIPLRAHTVQSEFDVSGITELPRVEILYGHAGQRRDLVDAAVRAGARGIVHAGVGNGNVHKDVKPTLVGTAKKGVVVVCSSRVGKGVVAMRDREHKEYGFVFSDSLNPQKARVLLQLALTVTADPAAIQGMFDRY